MKQWLINLNLGKWPFGMNKKTTDCDGGGDLK